jgi:hypothetical protein
MHYEEIELHFDASCQQIIGFESEILWEASSTPTLSTAKKCAREIQKLQIFQWTFIDILRLFLVFFS